MSLAEHAVVTRYDIGRNRVESHGLVKPSSESMTHGAIYDLGSQIRWVLHAHCPPLWQRAEALRLPCTPKSVDYGTVEMARAVQGLWRSTQLPECRIFAMLGHEDGIVTFGRTAGEAGERLVTALARAYALVCADNLELCTR
jgi:ribulose-5-phosphate 4-epimerase/fuculose-1-phosphate aldolase